MAPLRTLLSVAVVCGCLIQDATAQQPGMTGFVKRVFRDDDGEHKYVVFVPKGYHAPNKPPKKWPIILSLHGAGERGNDGTKQLAIGLALSIRARIDTYPFIVVFPQCEDVKGRILTAWASDSKDGKRALRILEQVEQEFSVDPQRRILTGWSMGGYGAWNLAATDPDHWAGVIPVSGGGENLPAARLTSLPIWAFHGLKDSIVPASETKKAIAAVEAAGGSPTFTAVEDGGHDIWATVYSSNQLIEWMLDPHHSSTKKFQGNPNRKFAVRPADDAPFVPAIDVPRAVYVRLGNNMLNAVSFTIPEQIPASALSGTIGQINDSTVVDGRNFSIAFTNISYSAKAVRAKLAGTGKDRFSIQVGLENVVLRIGRTYVTGRSHSATAGNINVVVGHRRPAWLTAVVQPFVKDRRLRLKLISSGFSIEQDNWYVSNPAGVSTRGFGMTEAKVSQGLVAGLYGSRVRIENEVRGAVPKLLAQVESKLEVADLNRLVDGMWPLPVYQPRVRVWPQEVSTDPKGATLVFGLTAAAVDPKTAPKTPRVALVGGLSAADIDQSEELQVGIAATMLGPLTQMLIDKNLARIHVLDIPGRSFASFVNPDKLSKAIPEIRRFGDKAEIWAELIVSRPLNLADPPLDIGPIAFEDEGPQTVSGTGTDKKVVQADGKKTVDGVDRPPLHVPQKVKFDIPKVVVSLSVRDTPTSPWKPFAEFEYGLAQMAQATISRPAYDVRALRLDWFGRPSVTAKGRFAPEYQATDARIDTEEVARLLTESWHNWTGNGPASEAEIGDIHFGSSKLRLNEIGWKAPNFHASFTAPGIRITNLSTVDFVYEVKGPTSSWGGPYTLKPEKQHTFEVPYSMLFRRKSGAKTISYTLPAGTHLEFRQPKTGGEPRLYQAADMRISQIAAEAAKSTK
ncbi:MAG: alpha/beta hydrolase-fold protein [Planctomycetota bacterium]|nr:alpha/beta hydrolase-fold protein [Planctomycetota bacterium]